MLHNMVSCVMITRSTRMVSFNLEDAPRKS
jgi:hypothetical protein